MQRNIIEIFLDLYQSYLFLFFLEVNQSIFSKGQGEPFPQVDSGLGA